MTGLLSGFVPGLHSNTIAEILVSLSLDKQVLSIMLIALFPAHLIASFVPSIFFGIPEEEIEIAVLPGQRFTFSGLGLSALKIAIVSCIIATIISIALFYVSIDFYVTIYAMIKDFIADILIVLAGILIIKSRCPPLTLLIFFVSGYLGLFSLNTKINDPVLPLFTGMFTIAGIMNYTPSRIPWQRDESIKFDFLKFVYIGVILGMFANVLPATSSPSQIASLSSSFIYTESANYIAAVSAIAASKEVFSLVTDSSINKPREGVVSLLSKNINISNNLLFILPVFIASMAISAGIIYLLRRKIAKLAGLNFSKMNFILVIYLILISALIDGYIGVGILVLSSILGYITIRLNVERTSLMGAIILPTILLLLKIFI